MFFFLSLAISLVVKFIDPASDKVSKINIPLTYKSVIFVKICSNRSEYKKHLTVTELIVGYLQ